MEAAAPSRSEVPTSPQRRRLPLAQLLFAAAGIALLVLGGTYALRFVSATTFHKERAFRVLDEIGSQLDNLQRTLANQLRLMPLEQVSSQCAREAASLAPLSKECRERRESYQRYQRRLALQGPKVDVSSVSDELFARACTQRDTYAWALRPRDPGVPFITFACSGDFQSDTDGRRFTVAFQGSLAETVERFVSQSFFDEVLLTLSDGTVVAALPRHLETRTADAPLHPVKSSRLGIVNASALLVHAGEDQKSSGPPAQPELSPAEIGDDRYRVFVRVVQPRYGTYIEQDPVTKVARQEQLYLIGLKRWDVRADLANSLDPGGRFLLTILTLLAFLAWPLASLRAKSPDDSIAWPEAVACMAAVVLIPAVLAIAAVWVWSYQGLLAWTDTGAVRYAYEVADTLQGELQEGRRLLETYEPLYRQTQTKDSSLAKVPLRTRDDGGLVMGRIDNCSKRQDGTCVIKAEAQEPERWGAWTTFSSIFATDARGIRDGERYTVYDAPLVKSVANYDDREYFRALQRHEGWAVRESRTEQPRSFVAQRLFSGSDGARVLQMAVPRLECQSDFCGIVTGSARFHSMSAAVSPPLLSFAVIDRDSGIVLFHSDDSRSLAENFFVETERNPRLLALTRIGQSGAFSGRYMGAGHRFFHLPMRDAPWSVVVFYSIKEVGDLPWHAVFTALAAYAAVLLLLLTVSLLGLWFWAKFRRKGMLGVAAGFWERTGRSCSYARWGLGLFLIAIALVTVYELDAGPASQVSLITKIMWGVWGLAAIAVLAQHRFAVHSICISLWLLLISAIPAAWMALGYHDVQVQGLLRDGLLDAATDIRHRRFVIADDLRRWLSSGEGRIAEFPSPWTLARPSQVMPVPGYESQDDQWVMHVFDEPPLATLITRRELDFWRRETWDASVQAETQQRRIRLLGHMNGWNPVCEPDGTAEICSFRTDDGQAFSIRTEAAKQIVAHRDEDDRRFTGITNFLSGIGALLAVMIITWRLSTFISRRVLGDNLSARSRSKGQHGMLFYLRRMRAEDVDRIMRGLRPGTARDTTPVTRVNVATKALYTELAADRVLQGPVLLTNLDIALVDASRRRDILDALERLADNPQVQLLIVCRRSPIDQLYHPERYPESGVEHACALEESLRWDNVLQKFECREIENMDAPRTHPSMATVDHHRTWKLCTRSERLLLYDVARGRLANPRNEAVIDALIARGLLKLDPWPKIADESFENFVRTAESAEELAQWQRDAVRGVGRWRSTVMVVLLIALLVAVIWFSWSAGDKFKVVTAIVAGAVAFLGQIGQAFNFVRSNAGGGRAG